MVSMGFTCIFVNKHLPSWPLLGLKGIQTLKVFFFKVVLCRLFPLYLAKPLSLFRFRLVSLSQWNLKESGFPHYNGNIRDNTIKIPIIEVGIL